MFALFSAWSHTIGASEKFHYNHQRMKYAVARRATHSLACMKAGRFDFHTRCNALRVAMAVQITRVKRKKPVLNWANVCSPNILRTVRRTIIRLLIELLVRRTWFGQSKLYFVLNRLVMRCKLRPELAAADAQQTA